jgi:diguanylate cyclase (GGDEF)-like protein/PAS domain S-box-containing protein
MGNDIGTRMEPDSTVYKTLLESTKAIPWKIDWQSMTFAYIGPQIEAVLGWSPSSWVGVQDWAERMHPDDRGWVVDFCVAQSLAGTDHEADYRAMTRTGDYVWIRDVVHVVRKENGEVDSLIGFMFDISERKKNEEELARLRQEFENLSFKDGLTNVGNRRMFDSVLQKEWDSAVGNNTPLSLLMLDIDFFKQYNDHYGHVQGDNCLRQISKILSAAVVRPRDFFARYGGEEFVFVLPEADAEAALAVAERCRELIAAARIPHEQSPLGPSVSISIGVGTIVPTVGEGPTAFIEATDTQLYRAKREGRNRIVGVVC